MTANRYEVLVWGLELDPGDGCTAKKHFEFYPEMFFENLELPTRSAPCARPCLPPTRPPAGPGCSLPSLWNAQLSLSIPDSQVKPELPVGSAGAACLEPDKGFVYLPGEWGGASTADQQLQGRPRSKLPINSSHPPPLPPTTQALRTGPGSHLLQGQSQSRWPWAKS